MDLELAERIVFEDHNRGCGYCEFRDEALDHVLDTVLHPNSHGVPGAVHYVATGDERVDTAYLAVLDAAR